MIIKPPDRISNRTTLHWGYFGPNSSPGDGTSPPVFTWSDLLKLTNMSAIPLILKMDCEGCEHKMFRLISTAKEIHTLPNQILLEIHIRLNIGMVKDKDGFEYHRLLEIHRILFEAGYTIFTNQIGDGGCEIGFIRL